MCLECSETGAWHYNKERVGTAFLLPFPEHYSKVAVCDPVEAESFCGSFQYEDGEGDSASI